MYAKIGQPIIPTNGLVFYHPLKENISITPTGQTISSNGSPTYTKVNGVSCCYFNGSSVIYTSSQNLAIGKAGTLSIWIKRSRTSTEGCIQIGYNGSAYCYINFNIFLRSQKVTSGYNGAQIYDDTVIGDSWHHILCTQNGSTISIYVDGILHKSGSLSVNCTATEITIGAAINYSSLAIEQSLVGYVAAARVYNRVLTEDEIKVLAQEFQPTQD